MLTGIVPDGVDALLSVLRDEARSMACRDLVSTVLADAGVSSAKDTLTGWLSSSDPEICFNAVSRLERLDWAPESGGEQALAAAHGDWNGVTEIGPAAVEPLVRLIRSSVAPVECLAAMRCMLEKWKSRMTMAQLRMLIDLPEPEALSGTAYGGDEGFPEGLGKETEWVRRVARNELRRRGIWG